MVSTHRSRGSTRHLWRHEPGPGASRRDATRTDSSFRVVATSRLVAPTELDSRLHPFSRGSTCRPDRARHQTPPRRLRIRLVDPSDSWVAPCRSDKVRLVRRRVPSDRARHVRLLRLSARRVARRVRPAARLVRPPVPSARVRLVRLVRLFDLSHDASTSRSDSSDKGRPQAGPTRPTRQTPRRFSSRSGPQVPLCTHCVNCIRSTYTANRHRVCIGTRSCVQCLTRSIAIGAAFGHVTRTGTLSRTLTGREASKCAVRQMPKASEKDS